MRECNFEELPQKLQDSIARSNTGNNIKVLRCLYDDKNYAECTVKNGSIFGLFSLSYEDVDSVWVSRGDIEFLYNAMQQESTRP